MFEKAAGLMDRKNQDYAKSDDPISNYRAAASIAGTLPSQYILARMAEKLARLSNILTNGGPAVEGEGFLDSCIDLINFPVLIAYAAEEEARSA